MRYLNVLYLGSTDGTSLDRANALRRLGHTVTHVDVRSLLPATVWVDRCIWKLGGHWFSAFIQNSLERRLAGRLYDVCHVDGGDLISPAVLEMIRKHAGVIVNYNIDDPLGTRDGARWSAYRKSIRHYDLCVVVREQNVMEVRRAGATRVLRVHMSADEITHAPRPLSSQDHHQWDTEVLFLGTWFPERGPFLAELVRAGVPLTIRGPLWDRAPEWPLLRGAWKGGYITGDAYAKAIQCTKINLGLLSLGNRDLHTTRSVEIPLLGGLLCAQRTIEHLAMYDDGTQAMFWSDAAECAEICITLLADETRRSRIAAAGQARARSSVHLNESVMATILERAADIPRRAA